MISMEESTENETSSPNKVKTNAEAMDVKTPIKVEDIKKEVEDPEDFIEFEFSPVKSPSKEKHGDLDDDDGDDDDDDEDVVDTIFDAAASGDHSKVRDLIYAKEKEEPWVECFDNNLELYKTRSRKRKNNTYKSMPKIASKKALIDGNKGTEFTNITNIKKTPPVQQPVKPVSIQPKESANKDNDGKLIDYSILTAALGRTLEAKLREDNDNDLKIVIFCNNKPIQSFSVKGSKKQEKKGEPAKQETNPKLQVSKSLFSAGEAVSNDGGTSRANATSPASSTSSDHHSETHIPLTSIPVSVSLSQAASPVLTSAGASQLAHNGISVFNSNAVILNNNNNMTPGTVLASRQGPVIGIASTSLLNPAQTGKSYAVVDNAGNVISGLGSSVNGEVVAAAGRTPGVMVHRNFVTIPKGGFTTDSPPGKKLASSKSSDVDENENSFVKCDQCEKTFKQKRYLNRHKIRVHRETSDKPPNAVNSDDNDRPFSNVVLRKDVRIDNNQIENLMGSKFVDLSKLPKTLDGREFPVKVEPVDEDEEVDVEGIKTEIMEDCEDRATREASAESEDSVTRYISSIIDDDLMLEEVKFADRGKRALYHTTDDSVKGSSAKDILSNTKTPPGVLRRTDSGMPLGEDGLIEPVYVCEECGRFYRARKSLKDHFTREHAKMKDDEPLYLYITGNKYQCPICFSNFHSGSELVAHTKKHTGELQIPCKLCGKVYSSVHVLRRHLEQVHTELRPRPFQCQLCDYAASNKWHLKEHYRRHTGEQPYRCPVCEKAFSHQGTMNRHCKVVHKMEVPSQKQFTKNTIFDLPVLVGPLDGSSSEASPSKMHEFTEEVHEEQRKENSEASDDEVDPGSLEIDLSVVKTEPMEMEDS